MTSHLHIRTRPAYQNGSCSPRMHDAGFALVTVIWIGALLAAAALMLTQAARTHVREMDAEISRAQAEAAADSAVHLALLDLMENTESSTQQLSGSAVTTCRLNEASVVATRVQDEGGKVDVNAASQDLLRALMTGLGWPSNVVDARADALLDFIDADSDRRRSGAEAGDYLSGGSQSGPKNGPLQAIEELARVKGFDDTSAQQLRPYVTVYSGQSGVDPRVSAQRLAEVLARRERAAVFDIARFGARGATIPAEFIAASTRAAFTVRAEAMTTNGARFVRDAVVSFRSTPGGAPYKIWRWTSGASFADFSDGAVLPSC